MEGPRGLRPAELASLVELSDLCFRATSTRSMRTDYPLLYSPANADNCRVIVEAGRVLSAANLLLREALVFGSRVSVAGLGGVCTHPDWRGQGLAGRCVDDAIQHATAAGADLMLVSGNRDLYRRRLCVRVGRWWQYDLTPALASRGRGPEPSPLEPRWRVAVLEDRDIRLAAALYRGEPVRYVRLPEDWDAFLASSICMNQPSQIYGVWEGDQLSAYLIASEPDAHQVRGVGEFAGPRSAVAAGLLHLAAGGTVRVHVAAWDGAGRREIERLGAVGTLVAGPGTVRLLRARSLVQKLKTRFVEMLGAEAADRISAEDHAEAVTFAYGSQRATIPRVPATLLAFDAPDGTEEEWRRLPGPVARLLQAAFPMPLPWYGLNYV